MQHSWDRLDAISPLDARTYGDAPRKHHRDRAANARAQCRTQGYGEDHVDDDCPPRPVMGLMPSTYRIHADVPKEHRLTGVGGSRRLWRDRFVFPEPAHLFGCRQDLVERAL